MEPGRSKSLYALASWTGLEAASSRDKTCKLNNLDIKTKKASKVYHTV